MSLVEALIIYFSAGAPFGVLVFFSQRTSKAASVACALLATAGWPIVGIHRLYRSLLRVRNSSGTPCPVARTDANLVDFLARLSKEVPAEPAELFAIAGHPDPWLATNCYARARRKVVDSHLDRLTMELRESSSSPVSGASTSRNVDLQTAIPS